MIKISKTKQRLVLYLIFSCISVHFTFSQFTITGKVKDNTNTELAGVNVIIKNTPTGAISDGQGNYKINVTSGRTLVFSYVGYATQEIVVGNQSTINITLSESEKSLDEVIVTGYGTTTRRNLTTSIAKIDAKNVTQAANSSVAQMVFGRAAGVKAIQQSAEPNGGINISIRGRGTPLIVIDGIVMPYTPLEAGNSNIAGELNGVRRGGFAGLNPDDIESMEFLKDASAAMYGVNASNGVVLITTKKGKSGRLSVNYSGSHSVVKNNKYLEPLGAGEYMSLFNDLNKDKYLLDKGQVPFGSNVATGFNPKYTASDIANAGIGTDWLGQVLRDGTIDNHSLNISGGSDKAVYFFSGNYFNQKGTMQKSGMERYTGRFNLTFNLSKYVSLNTNISGSKSDFLNSTAGWQNGGSGTQGFGALQAALAYPKNVPIYNTDGKYSLFNVTGNPVSLLDIQDQTNLNTLNTTVSLDFKLLNNDLTARLLYGNNYESSTRDFFVPSTTFYFQLNRARGSLNESKRETSTMEATLNYKKGLFNDKIQLDALVGTGQYSSNAYGFGAASADMLDAVGTTNLFAGSGALNVSSYKTFQRTRSYFGKANFDILGKYIVQVTDRYDGFSNFFPENKYAHFPSASVAWKVSNESFLKEVGIVNMLKIRGSIGITGEASGYAYASYVPDNSIIGFNSGGTQVIPYTLASLDQPNLQWPRTLNKNIGIDFAILNDKISGSFDFFQDDITRLIANASTAPLSSFGTQPVNGAHRIRKGYEIALNTKNINKKSFTWSSMFNISKVSYLHEERFPFETIPQGGFVTDPVNSIYVFKTNGLLQIGETASEFQPTNARKPGMPKFVDINGDNKLDKNDIVRYDSSPLLSLGFGNELTYKNWNLSVLFYSQLGGYGYNNLISWATPAGILSGAQSGIKEAKNIWTTTNPTGTLPGVAYDEFALGLAAGVDTRLEKTDFIRCRNITLGYTFNQPQITKFFKGLRAYIDLQNPFIITNYKIADPEVEAANVKGGAAPYPMATTYSLGVKTNF